MKGNNIENISEYDRAGKKFTKNQISFYNKYKGMLGSGFDKLKTQNNIYPDESLYENQITKIIKKHNGVFCPVIARDETDKIKMKPYTEPTFCIMNLSKRDDPDGGTHWTAIYIDKYDVCYYDSFGREPDSDIRANMKKMSDSQNCPHMRKFKYNTIDNQDVNSSDCGWMCIKFITNMLNGKSFKSATHFDETTIQKMIKGWNKNGTFI